MNKVVSIPSTTEQLIATLDQRGQQIAAQLDQYDIPDEKIKPITDYFAKLLCHNPHMKNHRIVRKTAEKFNLKLKALV